MSFSARNGIPFRRGHAVRGARKSGFVHRYDVRLWTQVLYRQMDSNGEVCQERDTRQHLILRKVA